MATKKRKRKEPLTPRKILTYCGIAAFCLTVLGGAGFTIMWPGQARSDGIESTHEADKEIQEKVDESQNMRLGKIEDHHQKIVEDLGGLKEGQKRIERSLERMANNQ